MRRISMFLIVVALLSCEEENNTSDKPINDTFDSTMATLLKEGTLAGIGHTVSGTVKVYDDSDGNKFVVLDPFMSQNGPDLKVYLSKSENASQYISLGPLKSITGKQSYAVPGNPDITSYTHVHIWCEQFSVVFGRAAIQ